MERYSSISKEKLLEPGDKVWEDFFVREVDPSELGRESTMKLGTTFEIEGTKFKVGQHFTDPETGTHVDKSFVIAVPLERSASRRAMKKTAIEKDYEEGSVFMPMEKVKRILMEDLILLEERKLFEKIKESINENKFPEVIKGLDMLRKGAENLLSIAKARHGIWEKKDASVSSVVASYKEALEQGAEFKYHGKEYEVERHYDTPKGKHVDVSAPKVEEKPELKEEAPEEETPEVKE